MNPPLSLPRFSFSASRQRAARALACLLVGVLSVCAASEALAYGMASHSPQGPFMGKYSNDFRFCLWESWGKIKISPTTTWEIPVGFTPVPNYQYSRILGTGWAFPLLESTLLPIGENKYEMILPTGQRQTLEKTKVANELKGGGWKATIQGKTITAQSFDRWKLTYTAGRLKTAKTPDGVQVEFNQNAQGTHWITANGTTVLTLKPAFDSATTRKVHHLHLQGGRHAELRYGNRPVFVKTAEMNSFGKPIEKKQNLETLVSVRWDGEPERKYEFDANTLTVTGSKYDPSNVVESTYKWNAWDNHLVEGDGIAYSFPVIRGIKCLQEKYKNGGSSLFGHGRDGTTVEQHSGGAITITENIQNIRSKSGMAVPRKVFVLKNGVEELVQQHWYDENGNEKKLLVTKDGVKILYEYAENGIVARDFVTRKQLWEKLYDSKKRIIKFQIGDTTYDFSYPEEGKGKNATVTRKKNEEKVVRTLSEDALKEFLAKI
jgi:hypothetical protein